MVNSHFTKVGKEAVDSATNVENNNEDYLVVELYIKEAITKRGLTQQQLAEMTKIRPAAISQLCRGYVERLNLDHIARIANALNIQDINELVRLVYSQETDFAMMRSNEDV